ncbi:hypothetical protein [Psychrobacter sp. DAB_AL43B]|uniref:hypothetical protein n=1 Tax=Psychrobacter sp. DAB_AL43B TaxID=1028416 RepID=UPI0009A6152B|nr:hypothetical protein [Psychrobacter sp. DAB_AL43B]SLJ84508.1 hypothetical protein DABAL43B_1312 [Psychrobacter sp. DAB_AL43B]
MRILIAVGLALVLSGCGGFDDMDAARLGYTGIGSNGSDNNQPSNPEEKTQWQYSSVGNSSGVFSLRADNYALNFFYDPKLTNVKHKPWVELERRKSSSGAVTSTVTIFVNSNLSCTPSCRVAINFDGNQSTYEMRNSIDGVIVPINEFTESQLFNKFTTSNIAIVNLPIIGLSELFEANFDLRDYDVNKMTF